MWLPFVRFYWKMESHHSNFWAYVSLNVQKRSKIPSKNAWIKRGTPLLEKLFRIIRNVDNNKKDYQLVQRWFTLLKGIAIILEPSEKKSSSWVEKRLEQYLNQIQKILNKESDLPFVDNLMNYGKGFWKGLFTCYDHPALPRTNNDLELFFRKTKQKHRRITGSRTWNSYILRHGGISYLSKILKMKKTGLKQSKKPHIKIIKKR